MEKEVLDKLKPLLESEISEMLDKTVDNERNPTREKKRRCSVLNSIGMDRLLRLLSPLKIKITLMWNDTILIEKILP